MHKSTNSDLITFFAAPCEGQIHHLLYEDTHFFALVMLFFH